MNSITTSVCWWNVCANNRHMPFLSWGVIFMIILNCYVFFFFFKQLLLWTDLPGYFWFYIYCGCFNRQADTFPISHTVPSWDCPWKDFDIVKAKMIHLPCLHPEVNSLSPCAFLPLNPALRALVASSSILCFSHNSKLPWILSRLLYWQ